VIYIIFLLIKGMIYNKFRTCFTKVYMRKEIFLFEVL
jgi:hypothetical protein